MRESITLPSFRLSRFARTTSQGPAISHWLLAVYWPYRRDGGRAQAPVPRQCRAAGRREIARTCHAHPHVVARLAHDVLDVPLNLGHRKASLDLTRFHDRAVLD